MKLFKRLAYHFRTLGFQVGIMVFAFVLIPVVVMVTIYYNNIKDREISSLSASITSQAQMIGSQISGGGYLDDNPLVSLEDRLGPLRDVFTGRLMIMDKSMRIIMDTYNVYEGRTLIWENALRSAAGETISEYDDVNRLLTVSIPVGMSNDIAEGNVLGVVMITRNADYINQNMEYFYRVAIIIVAVAILAAFIAALVASRYLSLNLGGLIKGLRELSEGRRTRLSGSSKSEIMRISDSVNAFADRARLLDSQMQEFVSNVSHELKTPLTSVKILADSINMSEDVPIEFYREFMSDITKEVDRETAIIDDLLKLVRTESDSSSFSPESANLNELMEEVLKQLSPIAEKAGVELVLETFRPVMAMIDRVKFSQAMINLVENAIKYNRDEGGFVHVSVNSDASYAFIRVEDNGVGIPEEDRDMIFERFFRVDKSRSKEIEGTGLGLAIVKNIINLHDGEIRVESIEGMGTTFVIRIPLFTG